MNKVEKSSPDVPFLEWVSDEGYMRLSKEAGHKWFKIDKPESCTTEELYELFVDDVHSKNDLFDDYLKKMIIENLCVEYPVEEATEQVNNAEIITKGNNVLITYDNGKSDSLKLITIEKLVFV